METGQQEFEALVKALLPTAKHALEDAGDFQPFGGGLTSSGSIRRIESKTEVKTGPHHHELAHWIDRTLAADALSGSFRATAAIVNVQVNTPKSDQLRDAVQIKLDHADGISLEIFFPYQIKRPGQVTFGEAFSQPGSGIVFPRRTESGDADL